MKKLQLIMINGIMVLALALGGRVGFAQGGLYPFRFVVEVDSAFVRAAPSPDADLVASVYEDDVLEVVGRNLDGTWFEVRRPGRLNNLGWLFNEMGDWDFEAEYLPLHDVSTGVTGPEPLDVPPEFAIFVIEGVVLRTAPYFQGERITAIPANSTVPLLARSPDGGWLYVNYLGYEGWIIDFTTRSLPNISAVPIAPGLPAVETFEGVMIPPEVQLAHVHQVRAYVEPALRLATDLEGFWWVVMQGGIVPCQPPTFLADYAYTRQDVVELPELDRYVPRLNEGIQRLNESIDPIYECGVMLMEDASQALADAINARLIFEATLEVLTDLEENVIH